MLSKLLRAPRQVQQLIDHPANRHAQLRTLRRWVAWQIGSRLVGRPVIMPFIDDTVLVIAAGLTGATGNIFYGLAEFEDMAFALHLLRRDDVFIDVGANVGSYSVLAAGAVGAMVEAFEPVGKTSDWFRLNMRANDLTNVRLHSVCIGSVRGEVSFTEDEDTTNHVAHKGDRGRTVPLTTLDDVCVDLHPTLIKIDVEGYEPEVLRGARKTLADPSLLALIVEINDAHLTYGFSRNDVDEPLRRAGFFPCSYRPFERVLSRRADAVTLGGNTIFVRDENMLSERLSHAPQFRLISGLI